MNTSQGSRQEGKIVSAPLSQSQQITLAAAFCSAADGWELVPS